MRFGLGPLSPIATAPGGPGWSLEAVVESSVLAEASGFDSVWFMDVEFDGGGRFQAPATIAAAAAARTRAVRLGVCPVVTRGHPLHLAEEVAVLDVLSNGRAIICPAALPVGSQENGRFSESVEVLLHAWSGDAFRYEGRFFRIPALLPANTGAIGLTKVVITPLPVQAPVPIWLPAWVEEARRMAAGLGVPLLGAPFNSLGELASCYEAPRDVARQRRIPQLVPIIREIYIASTRAVAWAAAENGLAGLYARYQQQGLISGDLSTFARLAADRFIIGDPEQCLAEIERYRETIGLNYLLCRFGPPGLDPGALGRVLELFVQTIGPHLRMFGYAGPPSMPTRRTCGSGSTS